MRALEGIEQRQGGLPVALQRLGLGEAGLRRRPGAGLELGVGERSARAHALERVAAVVGGGDRLLRRRDGALGAGELAEGDAQLREIAGGAWATRL